MQFIHKIAVILHKSHNVIIHRLHKNSTIFKTINANAKKLTEQFSLLDKSFRDIKKDFANGLGIKNSLFQTSISQSDYQALQKFNAAIKVTNDGLTKSQRITKAWNENMTGCSMAAKRMGNDLVTGKKKITDVSSAMNTATASTKALGVAMNIFANVGIMLAIAAVTKVISELAQAQEKARQAAKEATETYKDEISSIDDYKEKLSELLEELKSDNLSYEDAKTKRKELMSIQDELIDKFGTEKGAIESITTAINGQVDALDNLTEKAYRDWVAKADELTFWNSLLPWGKSGLDQAIDYMETTQTVSFYDMQNANLSDELQQIQKEIDETIRAKYNLDKTFAMFNVTGTPEEIKAQLEAIRQDYLDLSKDAFLKNGISSEMWEEYRKEAIESINEVINKFDKGISEHQKTYQTYIEGMIKYDSEYSDEYATILQKRAELESAQYSGNEEEIKKARQEFMDAINNGIEESSSNENIKKYFESLYPELQAEFADWEFEFAIDANTDGLDDTIKEIVEKYTATDLLGMLDDDSAIIADSAFNSLIDKAIEYGICTDKSAEEVQKLIDLLVELGYVQDNVKGDTFNNETPDPSASISQLIDQLNTQLKPAFDSLKSAYQNIFTDDGFNLNIVDIPMLEKIKSEIEELNNLKDVDININMADFDSFAKILTDVNTTKEQAQQAFDDLATSIFYATGATKGMTDETVQLVEQLLESLGVVNAHEVAQQALNEAKAQAVIASYDLIEASEDEYVAILNEAVAAGTTRQEIYRLIAAEIAFGNNDLSVEQKISKLQELARAYGDTATAAMATTISKDLANGNTDSDTAINNLMTKLNAGLSKVDIDFSGIDKSASKAGSSAGKAFTDALDKELNELDKRMEAGYIDFNDYIQARLGLIEDYYRQGKLSADQYYSYLEKHYKQELSYMDKVVNAVTRRIDKEIDGLEKQKDDIKNYYQLQIDSLEKQKTLLEEANTERQRQIDLQKALYEMERARNQRTILQYSSEKGMHYVADDKAIRDTQEDVDKARYQIQISEIEKSISKLEESRDKETDAIDEMIDKLEDYKDAWQDITSAYVEAQEDLLAAQFFGADWETDIINGRLDTLNDFKNQYISLQQAMADAAWQSANEQIKAAQEAEKGASGTPSSAVTINTDNNVSKSGGGGSIGLRELGNRFHKNLELTHFYGSGTNNAKKGLNLVGEDGDEVYFDNDGHVGIVTEPTLIPMDGGEVVKNERDTKKLLDPDNIKPVGNIGLADIDGKEAEYTIKVNIETNGEIPDVKSVTQPKDSSITLADGTVLTPIQPGDPIFDMQQKFDALIAKMGGDINSVLAPVNTIQKDMERMVNSISTANNVSNNRNQQVEIKEIKMIFPGVTSQEVAKQVGVEVNNLFNGLHLDAMQESMKR